MKKVVKGIYQLPFNERSQNLNFHLCCIFWNLTIAAKEAEMDAEVLSVIGAHMFS